jgi:UV DNA damage repair endonuclease
MFNQTVKRIGFACKWSEVHPKKGVISTEGLNTGGTTLTSLKKKSKKAAEEKMWEVMEKNITHTHNLVKRISTLDPSLRMVRLTSDMMTGYTHPDWEYFYKLPYVVKRMEQLFSKVGETARANDVRLSFHPGQFTVLASTDDNIVLNSIKEFEYHADMARMMGYGQKFQDMKINVHIAGRRGAQGIRDVYPRLSTEARNCITIENEEMAHGLDTCLELGDLLPIVLDIHHHWIREGEYISPMDDRVQRVQESWRGMRPTLHYSVSREDILTDHSPDYFPALNTLLESGHNKQKLRAHSDYYWNRAVNQWALQFLDNFDMMCESKAKNLASFKLYEEYKNVR